jgi:hypothetical protein
MGRGKLLRCGTVVTAIMTGVSPVQAGAGAEHSVGEACGNSTLAIRQLAVIDHTSDGGFQCLGVSVDGNTVKAIRLERHKPSNGNPPEQNIVVLEYPIAVAGSPRGAVIDGVPGHDAIVLRGDLSNTQGGARLVLSYLYNGITGEYHSCSIALDRTRSAGWRLLNRFDQPISLIGVRIRQVPVIGVVGIDNLEGACI